MITVTDNAVRHLQDLLESRGADPDQGLRLSVERGGCAGHHYTMNVASPLPNDTVVAKDGVQVLIDPDSLEFLQDAEVDYEDSLTDTGFKINNPNAARSCGCGSSFEPASGNNPPEYHPDLDGSACATDKNVQEP
ncbi:iron-sulfur cluster insertion protein ErpA [soil metagenome]